MQIQLIISQLYTDFPKTVNNMTVISKHTGICSEYQERHGNIERTNDVSFGAGLSVFPTNRGAGGGGVFRKPV